MSAYSLPAAGRGSLPALRGRGAAGGQTEGPRMTDTAHCDGWLRRIGYNGPSAPTLNPLRGLFAPQAMSTPSDCIDPLPGHPPALDPESLRRKLIEDGRGGYCWEQNMLFRAGL